MSGETKKTCFIAMPMTTHADEADKYGDDKHWEHVMEALLVPAVEEAGFEPIRPNTAGSHLIHARIVQHLIEADMVLCDLSGSNPNVFFELGVRTSLNRAISLVIDEKSEIPFDTSGIHTKEYSSTIYGWDLEAERTKLAQHLSECDVSCEGSNPLWKHFGLTITADAPRSDESPESAKLDLLAERVETMSKQVQSLMPVRYKSANYLPGDSNETISNPSLSALQRKYRQTDAELFQSETTRRGLLKPHAVTVTGPRAVEVAITAAEKDDGRETDILELARSYRLQVEVKAYANRHGKLYQERFNYDFSESEEQ
ncbi:hypothetical protein [Demequina salsinemoris]|uniref:hypothetical protein n=1 Tax=Demequina salsinemoris TaxID=577470 RepID=UPI000784CA98|nr:hypothetical protein [Demequina salsinemoris]